MKKLYGYYSFKTKGLRYTPNPILANAETLATKNLQRQIDFKIQKTLKKLQREVINGVVTDPRWTVNPNA